MSAFGPLGRAAPDASRRTRRAGPATPDPTCIIWVKDDDAERRRGKTTMRRTGQMSITEAVAAAKTYLEAHPDEARYRDSAAVARLIDGLRVEVTGTGGESATTDMPAGIGGTASAPSPGWLLRAAIASCVA